MRGITFLAVLFVSCVAPIKQTPTADLNHASIATKIEQGQCEDGSKFLTPRLKSAACAPKITRDACKKNLQVCLEDASRRIRFGYLSYFYDFPIIMHDDGSAETDYRDREAALPDFCEDDKDGDFHLKVCLSFQTYIKRRLAERSKRNARRYPLDKIGDFDVWDERFSTECEYLAERKKPPTSDLCKREFSERQKQADNLSKELKENSKKTGDDLLTTDEDFADTLADLITKADGTKKFALPLLKLVWPQTIEAFELGCEQNIGFSCLLVGVYHKELGDPKKTLPNLIKGVKLGSQYPSGLAKFLQNQSQLEKTSDIADIEFLAFRMSVNILSKHIDNLAKGEKASKASPKDYPKGRSKLSWAMNRIVKLGFVDENTGMAMCDKAPNYLHFRVNASGAIIKRSMSCELRPWPASVVVFTFLKDPTVKYPAKTESIRHSNLGSFSYTPVFIASDGDTESIEYDHYDLGFATQDSCKAALQAIHDTESLRTFLRSLADLDEKPIARNSCIPEFEKLRFKHEFGEPTYETLIR